MVTVIITGHSDSIGHRIIEHRDATQDTRNCYCDLSQKRGEIPLQHRKDISVTGTVSQPPETVSTVPSQADLFGSIGLQLGLGRNKIPNCWTTIFTLRNWIS